MLDKINMQVKIEFSVRDTGIGLSEEQKKRIFEDFSQADGSTTRKYGGTGLGLSISRKLVAAMGGQLQVESEAGRGSRFFFSLWFGTDGKREAPLTEVLRGRKFVIADSRTLPWRSLMSHLELASAEVRMAASGRELIEHLHRTDSTEPCDLVFIYARLQDIGGLELARQIKTDPDLRQKPAVVLVDHRDEFSLLCADKTAREGIADDILMAPITPSDMMNTVIGIFAPMLRRQSLKVVEEHDWKDQLKGIRVLMAEDNLINQEIALELLTQAGCEVRIAGDGCQAVEEIMAADRPIDIVLMDVQMPHMDGLDATRLIRADGRFQDLPIVAMTAHAMNDARERCLNAGMNAHIVKPINPEDLFKTIIKFCTPEKIIPTKVEAVAIEAHANEKEIPAIPGLDIESGLRRVMGNTELYYKLLRRFVEEQANVSARIAGIIDTGDKTRAAQLVHSIKGVAGNLGAVDLFTQAQLLERCIKESRAPDQIESELLRFSEILANLVLTLKRVLPDETVEVVVNKAEVREVPQLLQTDLAKFVGLLKESRLELIDCFKTLRDELQRFSSPDEFAIIERAVRTGEFEQAIAPLCEIAARLQIKIDDR
jgi:two-component system sensor histidine kinase/response regulator